MTYKDAIDYIHSVAWKGSRPGLERVRELLYAMGDPQDQLKIIHVSGTNGKGSFCTMTEAILRAAGLRTGLFTSPYIKNFNEQISVSGEPITDEELAEITAYVKPFADAMQDSPTEFELITAIAFVYFAKKGCDVVIAEVGMGGRLDSTNVIRSPLLSVITGISVDHTAFLGDSIEKIAAEKAGIIKKGSPVLFGGDNKNARAIIEKRAVEMSSHFSAVNDTPISVIDMTLSGTTISYGEYRNIFIPLLGLYQPKNLASVLAGITILKRSGLAISDEAIRDGLAGLSWRGRFEKLSDDPMIISDGAHNPEGVIAARDSIRHYFGDTRVLLVTGVMADKDYEHMINILAPVTKEAFCIKPQNARALDAELFADAFRSAGVSAKGFACAKDALSSALDKAKKEKLPIICLGSLYMYDEITDALGIFT